MKRYGLVFVLFPLFLVACGENVSINDLWEDYQGEVLVYLSVDDWSTVYDKDLSGLNRYEFLYLDGDNLHEIKSFAKNENGDYVSTEDGIEMAEETIVPLEEYFIPIPKTRFFMRNFPSKEYTGVNSLFWFDDGEEICIQSVPLYEALDEKLSLEKQEFKDIIPKIQEREEAILNIETSCHYHHIKGASSNLIKEDFVDDLKLEEKLGFKTPFELRDMKINITGIEAWSKVDNRYSDYNGKDVFLLAVELENLSDEKNKLNMFSYQSFDPKGKESPRVSAYFDKTLRDHEELLAGGKTKALYPILYNGDGEYQIHFGEEKIVILDIKKD